jgi:proteic killer suppression protein
MQPTTRPAPPLTVPDGVANTGRPSAGCLVRLPPLSLLTSDNCQYTLVLVIVSVKHQGLKRLYQRGDRSQIRQDLLAKVENILALLDAATAPQALDLPGYRLDQLKGERKEFWAVTVRANWRIIFRFEDGDAHDVELINCQ